MSSSLMLAITLVSLAGITVLALFYSYENRATKIMSGDHKSILVGHLLEAKVTALKAMLDSSVSSSDGNELFQQKLKEVQQDAATVGIDTKSLSGESLSQAPDDLFVQYRNIKTAVFNLYRESWVNKWMTVARVMGMVLNDLENIPFGNGQKAVLSIQPKLAQIINVVTGAAIPQNSKLFIINKLNSIKALISTYSEGYEKSQTIKKERERVLNAYEEKVKAYNNDQEKALQSFTNGNDKSFLKAVLAFTLLLSVAVLCAWAASRKFAKGLAYATSDYLKQLGSWLSDSGATQISTIQKPSSLFNEFDEIYDVTDQVVKRVNNLRREDVIIKKLVQLPYVLITRNTKKAVYWNSALGNLAKARSVDEQGIIPYLNLLRFTDVQGKVIDPVEKCILENREIALLALFRSGSDSIATQVTCSIFHTAEGEEDYVLMQLRDLREENKRVENELDRQIELVNAATAEVQAFSVPATPPHWAKRHVTESIQKLQDLAYELDKMKASNKKEISRIWEHFEKEFSLKKGMLRRLEDIKADVASFTESTSKSTGESARMQTLVGGFRIEEKSLSDFFSALHVKGQNLCSSLDQALKQFEKCTLELEQIEKVSTDIEVHEKNIRELVQRTSLLNINNSIMESRKGEAQENLSPEHLILITENLNQILYQFQKAYMLIEQSVHELKVKAKDSRSNIRAQMEYTKKLFDAEYNYSKNVREAEKKVELRNKNLQDIMVQLDQLQNEITAYAGSSSVILEKSDKMLEIFNSSIKISEVVADRIKLTERVVGDQVLIDSSHDETLAASS